MRRYGLLLHISSLPSAYGIGDLGPAAYAFIDVLSSAGASVWQFLPLNPTSTFIGNSPYSSPSAFAGNPLLISPELLVRDGFLSYADLESSLDCLPQGGGTSLSQVDFAAVTEHRSRLLSAAYERNCLSLDTHADFQDFCRDHETWLHDYARFVSLKEAHGGVSWTDWPQALRLRDPEALRDYDHAAARRIQREKFIQYLFFSQWRNLRAACNAAGISLMADVPIYVTHDSADVWANPHLFSLDETMQPLAVSGVPPDYFSVTGQRWGTPLYNWKALANEGFAWWKRRLGHVLLLADTARLDHFRAFSGYWEIPAEEETAVNGKWRRAPARAFFSSMRECFGGLPFLAEDLGVITEDVREIMRDFALPGMHVLQFAFGGTDLRKNPDIPYRHGPLSVTYTGTHDNPPTAAWFARASEEEKKNLEDYAGQAVCPETACRVLARLAFAGVSDCVVLPVQDVLGLGEEARMNQPGIAAGNWAWRLLPDQLRAEDMQWLSEYARIYGRLPCALEEDGCFPEYPEEE